MADPPRRDTDTDTDGGGGRGPEAGERQGDNRGVIGRARQAKRSGAGHAVARIGLGSRAVVYLCLAVLTVQFAAGQRRAETDQGGVFQVLGRSARGKTLLAALALGIFCYVGWRWSEAALGARGEEHQRRARTQAVVEGLCYLPFGIMAIAVLLGDPGQATQSAHYRTASARVLQWPPGQFLLGTAGVIVAIVGLFLASQGIRTSFEDQLDFENSTEFWRRVTLTLGVVGSIGRGVVFAMAGVLVVVGAATVDPQQAGGIDTTLRTLARQPYGQVLLLLAATGFAAFGLFTLAEAKWRIT